MLKNTNKSILEIALECGFNSQSYFCSTFKKNLQELAQLNIELKFAKTNLLLCI